MKRDWFVPTLIFTLLLCWPALYRLTLPGAFGDMAYYLVAYAAPMTAFLLVLWHSRNAAEPFLLVLGIALVLFTSIALADSRGLGLGNFFYAVKFYLTPVLLIILGAFLTRRIDPGDLGRLLLVVVGGHLVFSVLFYFNILPNAVYSGEAGGSDNWTSVVGGYRAFVGLTLSKFDLAYQVGFLLVGSLFCGACFRSALSRMTVIVTSAILVIFTYNKTVVLVVVLALLLRGYGTLRKRSSFAAHTLLVAAGLLIAYPIVRFLNGDIVLTDLFTFLSPQTFWSRVMIWQDVAAFDWQHLFRGIGAGSLAQQDITLDNQFLYAYVELGVLGALAYFALFATLIARLSSGHPFGRAVLILLAAVFVVGDILNAHALMFVVGLFLGTIRGGEVPINIMDPAPRTRSVQYPVSQLDSRG